MCAANDKILVVSIISLPMPNAFSNPPITKISSHKPPKWFCVKWQTPKRLWRNVINVYWIANDIAFLNIVHITPLWSIITNASCVNAVFIFSTSLFVLMAHQEWVIRSCCNRQRTRWINNSNAICLTTHRFFNRSPSVLMSEDAIASLYVLNGRITIACEHQRIASKARMVSNRHHTAINYIHILEKLWICFSATRFI